MKKLFHILVIVGSALITIFLINRYINPENRKEASISAVEHIEISELNKKIGPSAVILFGNEESELTKNTLEELTNLANEHKDVPAFFVKSTAFDVNAKILPFVKNHLRLDNYEISLPYAIVMKDKNIIMAYRHNAKGYMQLIGNNESQFNWLFEKGFEKLSSETE